MVNTCESVIKTVMRERAKVVVRAACRTEIGSSQKVRRLESGFNGAASWTLILPVDSGYLTSRKLHERNVETLYTSPRSRGVSVPRGALIGVQVWDVGKSECRAVIARIPVETSPGTKVSPRPTGVPVRENSNNHHQERMQMTGPLGAPGALSTLPGWRLRISIAQVERAIRVSAGSCNSGLMGGLSRMRGNQHVRFLGEFGARKGPLLRRRSAIGLRA